MPGPVAPGSKMLPGVGRPQRGGKPGGARLPDGRRGQGVGKGRSCTTRQPGPGKLEGSDRSGTDTSAPGAAGGATAEEPVCRGSWLNTGAASANQPTIVSPDARSHIRRSAIGTPFPGTLHADYQTSYSIVGLNWEEVERGLLRFLRRSSPGSRRRRSGTCR